jgi:hypothetical protein
MVEKLKVYSRNRNPEGNFEEGFMNLKRAHQTYLM